MKKNLKTHDFLIMAIDIAVSLVAFLIAYFIRSSFESIQNPLFDLVEYAWILWIFIPTQYLSFAYFGLYGSKKTNVALSIIVTMVKAFGMTVLISAAAVFLTKSDIFSRLLFIIFISLDFILLVAERLTVKAYLTSVISKNSGQKHIIIVCDYDEKEKVLETIRENEDITASISGFVSIKDNQGLGNVSDISRIAVEQTADEVYFMVNGPCNPHTEKAMLDCEKLGVTVKILLNLFDFKFSKTELSYAGKTPMLTFHTVSLNEGQLLLKRIMDICASIAGLVITGILTIFIAPAIKLESKGPVFFAQRRVGQNGRIFKIYKYRTMVQDAESKLKDLMKHNELSGAVFKMENDPRVTRVGNFLRKTSLDEFPQFWNILKGEMSLVGTRPPTVREVEEYEIYHRRRLSIKPGLTGMWQVSGRNEITDFEDIYTLDISYIDNWTIAMDIKILFKTFSAVLLRKGAK